MTTVTLQPDATAGIDTSISSGSPAANFGVSVGMSTGKIGTTDIRRSQVMFSNLVGSGVNQVPSGATINTATLTLYCDLETVTTDYNVGVHRALTQWFEGLKDGVGPSAGEDGSSWNFRNVYGNVTWDGGAGGASGSDWVASATSTTTITETGTTFDWNVKADVQAWVNGTATNYGWWLINVSESTTNSRKRFVTSDGATASQRPKLVIDWSDVGITRPVWLVNKTLIQIPARHLLV